MLDFRRLDYVKQFKITLLLDITEFPYFHSFGSFKSAYVSGALFEIFRLLTLDGRKHVLKQRNVVIQYLSGALDFAVTRDRSVQGRLETEQFFLCPTTRRIRILIPSIHVFRAGLVVYPRRN